VPNNEDHKKRVRQTETKKARNKTYKTRFRNVTKSLLLAIEEKQDLEVINSKLVEAYSALDKAAKQGIIHKNQASRRKARLNARVKNYSKAL